MLEKRVCHISFVVSGTLATWESSYAFLILSKLYTGDIRTDGKGNAFMCRLGRDA